MVLEAILFFGLFHHKKKPVVPTVQCPVGQILQGYNKDFTPVCAVPDDPEEMVQAKMFIMAVENKIPEWYKDEAYAQFEMTELATVQADAAMCHIAKTDKEFYDAVAKLHTDWDNLVVLDEQLHTQVRT